MEDKERAGQYNKKVENSRIKQSKMNLRRRQRKRRRVCGADPHTKKKKIKKMKKNKKIK